MPGPVHQKSPATAAAVLAVVSAFFVPPDVQYLGYIDLRTLAILFSLMAVMAGLRRQGFFDGLGRALLSRTHSTFQLTLVLVGLCFFGSMFITNDVSLLTFVPFTFVVLSLSLIHILSAAITQLKYLFLHFCSNSPKIIPLKTTSSIKDTKK